MLGGGDMGWMAEWEKSSFFFKPVNIVFML